MSGYAAVVLAAGRATRFRAAGGLEPTKVLAMLRGAPLVRHVVTAAIGASVTPIVLVTGHAGEAVAAAVADLPLTVVHNADFAAGLSGSLRLGLGVVPRSCHGAVVLLGDMPDIDSAIIDGLVSQGVDQPDADAVVPVHADQRGNPVLLSRSLFAAAARLTGDAGARQLLRDPSVRVALLRVTDPAVLHDVDLPEHLHGAAIKPRAGGFTVR